MLSTCVVWFFIKFIYSYKTKLYNMLRTFSFNAVYINIVLCFQLVTSLQKKIQIINTFYPLLRNYCWNYVDITIKVYGSNLIGRKKLHISIANY